MKKSKVLISSVMASSLVLSILPSINVQASLSSAASSKAHEAVKKNRTVNFVDAKATNKTKSLFAYLNDVRGKHVLFGHQHTTDEGLTLTGSGKPESDVKNSVGDFPALFGWDTLSLEGKEKPGVPNDAEKSRENLAASMKEAHDMGGILALSTHFPNFVTGGSFNDTAGSVVEHILPGGDKNDEFNAFLDNIALFAKNLKDDKGDLIPVLFRPFHEQNGGWFWWGAKTTTTSQYVEIYRYTVEYLRDRKGVHNFLYVYSPNGTFGGSEDSYLTTYPGDEYVDILGMDQYDNQSNPGSEQFLKNLVSDLGMISKLADRKGKIATFSEFGYSPQGMKTTGNGDLQWFTRMMNAIKADPDARRISYMQTWANFALNGNLFVPYNDAPNGLGDHELLPDFINYYKDPYTSFLDEVEGVYKYKAKAAHETPFMHIASPTANSTVTNPVTKIRTRVLNEKPSKVVYSVEGSHTEVPMKLDTDGFYSADWAPGGEFNGKSANITVKTFFRDHSVQEQTVKVFVKVPEISMKKYTFDSGITDVQNNGTYPESIKTTFEHAVLNGDGKLKINVTGLNQADTWQEIKLELPKAAQEVYLDAVKRVKMDVLIPSNAGSNANASIRGIVMLPPDWDTKYGMAATEQKLSGLEKVSIDGMEYFKYPVTIDLNDSTKSEAAESLALSLVGSGLTLDGALYADNIELLSTYAEAASDPSLVDDFESYQGDSAALAAKFVHAGGDAASVSLTGTNKSSGTYAMKIDYTLAGSGYAGITKSLGGVDWSGFNKLKFWLVPDGKNQKMVVQLKVDGVSYEAYPSLAGTAPGWVEIPFNQFTVAPWDIANAGKKLNKVTLKNVQDFSVYVNAVNGAALSSTLYLDDIKAINDGTGGVPNGGTGPGSSPEPIGTLYDFESDIQGWAVEQNQAGASVPAISLTEAAKGTSSLQSTFDLSKTAGFELTKVQAADLSAADSISAQVKLSSGTANVRLYIKTGSNWNWHDSGVVSVDSSGFKTIVLPLDSSWGLDSVKSIGIKIEPVSGSGNASVYVDDIALSNK
ncbi:mannan endo-1,4-beta-mannosidase [Peribacillus deserti]|uniref:Mannan endo-1,4-beta-mannosidase n=1 Tax=Peribacillus deserti TaxID=673318 RepID=A0ABS2QHQ6_9BACI|nr:glycosyl hydrolase [Peribacillus deserti]MBM7692048.1 mannan endo-1,4-beta-mannosidase [Peribacillus deserti]